MGNLVEQKIEIKKDKFSHSLLDGREKINDIKKMNKTLEEKNLHVKLAMAKELKRLGLTEKAIARQLNLTI